MCADLEALGQIGRVSNGGLNRTSFSSADTEARDWYIGRCAEAGLTVRTDGLGNLIVSSPRVAADIAARPAVWSGSHIDTVPHGGQFDGALGAIAALECLRRIHEEGIVLDRPVCSVVYTDEEGNYAHLLGSSALARGFSRSELEAMVGRNGDPFADTFAAAGGSLDAAQQTRVDPASLHATVELHIEQGLTLEKLGHQIGVVTGIVGLGGGVVTFQGRADHAGTTPMTLRKDALVAAGALVAAFPNLAAKISDRAVITCGMIGVEPGSAKRDSRGRSRDHRLSSRGRESACGPGGGDQHRGSLHGKPIWAGCSHRPRRDHPAGASQPRHPGHHCGERRSAWALIELLAVRCRA